MDTKAQRAIMAALVAVLLAGLCLILYPALSDLWNSHVQSRVVASYAEAVDAMDEGRGG